LCPFCPGQTEDEGHVLFSCDMYASFRPDTLSRMVNVNTEWHQLFSSTDVFTIRCVCIFLLKVWKTRSMF
jgi:hypothetical protein